MTTNFRKNQITILLLITGCLITFAQENKVYTSLKEALNNKKSVYKLDLSSQNLTDLPESLGDLNNLQELDLSNNYFIDIPKCVFKLTKLNVFIFHEALEIFAAENEDGYVVDLDYIFPEGLENLTNLKELDLGGNNYNNPPESFYNLTQLEKLDLGGNSIDKLSNNIGNLKQLKELNVSSNQLYI